MSASEVNMYQQFGHHVHRLIDHCVESAVNFCNDMYDEVSTMPNLSEFRAAVLDEAWAFMRMELDPEHGDIVLPPYLANAIGERVNKCVQCKFYFE